MRFALFLLLIPWTLFAAPLPFGTTTYTNTSCPSTGVQGATCYSVTVTCPGVAKISSKVKWVQASPELGAVLYTTGGDGDQFYDVAFEYGQETIEDLMDVGLSSVQVKFSSSGYGWMQGPGGLRKLTCRPATMAKWVRDHLAPSPIPYCWTGNSAGASMIAGTLSWYGLENQLTAVVPTSGPPTSRLDLGCYYGGVRDTACWPDMPLSYAGAAARIDAGYGTGADTCSNAGEADVSTLLWDSFYGPGVDYIYTPTVTMLIGSLDMGEPPALASEWYNWIQSEKSQQCVEGASHGLADSIEGYRAIVAAVTEGCL